MAEKHQLSKEMIENIKNYSNEIKTLKDFVEAVRKRPGMYLGPLEDRGMLQMFREILQNAIDEMVKQASPCDTIRVIYNEATFEVIIEDNGRGFPFDKMESMLTAQHTGSNYEKKPFEYSSGLNGVGAKVVNALSEYFIVESYRLGEAKRMTLIDGRLQKIEDIKNPQKMQGSIVKFKPLLSILGQLTLTSQDIRYLTGSLFILTPRSDVNKIYITCYNKDGSTTSEVYDNRKGVAAKFEEITANSLTVPIEFFADTGFMQAYVVFSYDAGGTPDFIERSYSNMTPTSKGTHIEGFKDGIVKFLKKYMNTVFLPANAKRKIEREDILYTLRAVVSVAHLEPNFVGQAKDELSNSDMKKFVSDLVQSSFGEWVTKNPKEINKICRYLKDISDMRAKLATETLRIADKYETNSLSGGLPSKYVRPTGNKDLELFIVEGNSAKGGIKSFRDKVHQGVFPLRGKIPNALSTPKHKFLDNAEISGMIRLFGYNPNTVLKDCNPAKCRFKKIIIMTDADSDGAHIRTLIIMFIAVYLRPLLEAGLIYIGMPPLYGIEQKKGKYEYFINKTEYQDFVNNSFIKKNVVTDIHGKKLSNAGLLDLLSRNIDYVSEVTKMNKNFAVNPRLLESIILNYKFPYNKFKKAIENEYRFITVSKLDSGNVMITGEVDLTQQFIVMNERFLKFCENMDHLINEVNDKQINYIINDQPVTLFKLMTIFDKSIPALQRYKGLGEMDGQRLFESAVDINTRTIIKYTSDDFKRDIDGIHKLNSEKSILAKRIVSVSRFDL
jgi:DNA gyrase subunit B